MDAHNFSTNVDWEFRALRWRSALLSSNDTVQVVFDEPINIHNIMLLFRLYLMRH